jgi:hypothetical protein
MPDILITDGGDIVDAVDSGLDFLAGMVVDNILNTISSDLYSPNFGTDLSMLPRYNVESKTEITMKFMLAVEHVQAKIIEEQALTPSTPDETLSRIKIIDIYETGVGLQQRWLMKLRVFSESGDVKDLETNINKILKI